MREDRIVCLVCQGEPRRCMLAEMNGPAPVLAAARATSFLCGHAATLYSSAARVASPERAQGADSSGRMLTAQQPLLSSAQPALEPAHTLLRVGNKQPSGSSTGLGRVQRASSVFLATGRAQNAMVLDPQWGARRRRNSHRLAGRCGRMKFPVPMLYKLPSAASG